MEIKPISAIKVTFDKFTEKEYLEGSIITVQLKNEKRITGKLCFADEYSIGVDCSEKYKSVIHRINICNIERIANA